MNNLTLANEDFTYYETLAELWKDADSDLPALAEVRAGKTYALTDAGRDAARPLSSRD